MSRLGRTILTRGYEVDARGRVSLGAFARYFEVVRSDYIRAADSPLRELFRDGGLMVMRAQRVELFGAFASLATLEVDAGLASVGSSSMRFLQTARAGGKVVAQNVSVAVAVDAERRPARVTDAVRAMATGEPVDDLPTMPESPGATFNTRAYVRPSDLDLLNHVNHSRYVDFVDDAYQHARAGRAYGDDVPDGGYAITIEYDGETRLVPELGAERHLMVETWRTSSDAFAFQLIDPLDGRRVSRALLEASHEICSRRFAGRRIGL
jgi:acyl-CoA thioesterase FadM